MIITSVAVLQSHPTQTQTCPTNLAGRLAVIVIDNEDDTYMCMYMYASEEIIASVATSTAYFQPLLTIIVLITYV